MMKKNIFLTISLVMLNTFCIAQDNPNTIDDQFNLILKESNNYQTYKIVSKAKLERLQRNVNDSINKLHSEIDANKNLMLMQKTSLDSISNQMETMQNELKTALKNEDHLSVLGINTHKSTFKTCIWFIIGILLIALGVLYYRFKKSHIDTKSANKKLIDTEQEFEDFRKLSLEREQKIRRQLQDEINKNKNT